MLRDGSWRHHGAATGVRTLRRRSAARRETVALALFFTSVLALYLWIADTSAYSGFGQGAGGRYGLIADALRHGQLSLRMHPPAGLLALPNPYDPTANLVYRGAGQLHDLSLRNGHLYGYWGPTAAVVLFAPLQIVGVDFPESLAVALFGFLGFVFSVALLRFLVRRFLPSTPAWAIWAAMVALALSNVVPFVLRRPAVYEVAITCAMCFGFLGLWLVLAGWYEPSRRAMWRLAGGGVALGLALLSRPTLGTLGLVPALLAFGAWRGAGWPGGRDRRVVLAAVFGPLVVCGLLYMAYNMARFGAPLEFGAKYQLAGADPADHPGGGDVAYVPPGLFLYLFEPPRPLALFPFLQLGPPPAVPWAIPKNYTGLEPTGGVVPMIPLLVAIAFLPFAARRWDRELRRVLLAMVVTAGAILLGLSLVIWGTTQRYEVDFATLFLIPALLIWFTALVHARPGGWRRRLAIGGGVAALAWGASVGLAASFTGYLDTLLVNHPRVYHRLETTFSPVSRLVAGVAGRPIVARIDSPFGPGGELGVNGGGGWGSFGAGRPRFVVPPAGVTVNVVAPRPGRYLVRATLGPGPHAVPDGGTQLFVSTPGGQELVAIGATERRDIPVTLEAGINRVSLATSAASAQGPGLVAVRGITIREP